MKVMLLAGLYLFFVRVLWSVYNELREPAAVGGAGAAVASTTPALPGSPRSAKRRAKAAARSAQRQPPVPGPTGAPSGSGRPVTELVIVDPAPVAGQRWRLGDVATIGRSDTCDVCFDDTYMSGVHARLFARDGQHFVEDLESRNGTMLNGEAIEATIAVRPGDRLRIGATTMEFQ